MGNEGITPAADIGLASLVRRFPDARDAVSYTHLTLPTILLV